MARPPRKPDRRAQYEELEPRLLMSADAAGVLLGPTLAEGALSDDATAQRQLLDTAAAQPLAQSDVRRELVFLDRGIEDHEQLLEELRSRSDAKLELEIVVLDPDRSGIDQIAAALERYEELDAVHIVSHGTQGAVQLGSGWLTAETLESRPGVIASWGDALSNDGDLLFYGCDLAGNEGGAALVESLAQLTGADVAASVDVTGSALLGGDWDLEQQSGAIESASLLSADTQWQGRLAAVAANGTASGESELWSSDGNWGQTFSHTSGGGTYAVDSVGVQLREDTATPGTSITVSIRDTWDGPALASDTILANTLSTTLSWQAFDMGGVSLTDGQAYVIQVDASSPAGKVYVAYDSAGTYGGGDRLDNSGATTTGDLTFVVETADAVTAPILIGIEGTPLDYTENDGPLAITDTLTIWDAPTGTLDGAVIRITGNFASGEDVLKFSDTASIVGVWDGAGTLTLSGTDSLAAYQAALRSVTYENTSESPSTATRTVSFEASDPSSASAPLLRSINVISVADTPSVTDASTLEDTQTPSGLVLTPNASDGAEVSHFKITGITGGTLFLNDGTSQVGEGAFITVSQGAAGLKFTPAPSSTADGSFGAQASLAADDAGLGGAVVTATITVTPLNSAPVVDDQTFAVDENSADGTVVGTVIASDPDAATGLIDYLGFSEAKATFVGSTSLTIPTPAGVQQGELLIAAIALDNDHALSLGSPPGEGWNLAVATQIPNEVTLGIWWKTADAGESASHQFTWSAGDRAYGWIMRFSGQNSADPIDALQILGGFSPNPVAPSVDTTVDDVLILRIGAFDRDDISVDAPGLDIHTPITMDEVGSVSGGAGFETQAAPGASGSALFDLTTSRDWLAATLALKPETADPLDYAITAGNADGAFAIDGVTGEITVADGSLLDFETLPSRDLTVEVTDGGGSSATATVTIDLNDVNEAPSVSGGPFTVAEDASSDDVVGNVSGSDPDAGTTLGYAITGGDPGGAFKIDGNGEITVDGASQLDFDTTPFYDLQVEVTDDGTPPLTAMTTVRVDLTNVNEAPSVSGGPFAIAESASSDDVVGSVTGSDPDAGTTLGYAITGGDPAGAFKIDGNGEITVDDASQLDFDTTPFYDLQVQVTDDGTPPLTTATTVRVNLTDVNEAPSVSGGPFSVAENASSDDVVGSVTASDPDAGTTLGYAITGGDPAGAFKIDGNGEITVDDASQLDFDTTPFYDLQVEVTDDGTPPLTTATTVRVNLTNVNEAPSVTAASFALAENSANGTLVGTVSASDPDVGDRLRFAIVAGNTGNAFAIDSVTGVLTVNDSAALDFEATPFFALRVVATDDGAPSLAGAATVRVTLTGVNEAPSALGASVLVAEGSIGGTSVSHVNAADPDAGDVLQYAIVSGNIGNAFAIDPATGEITVNDPTALDFETNPVFQLTVQVSDDGNPTLSGTVRVTVQLVDLTDLPIPEDDPGKPDAEPPPADDPGGEPPVSEEPPSVATSDPPLVVDAGGGGEDPPEREAVFSAALPKPQAGPAEPATAVRDEETRASSEARQTRELTRDLASQLPLADQVFERLRSDFFEDLDRVRDQVVAPEGFEGAVAGSSLSLAAGLSVGYALLLTRGGLLLASLVSSMPAWRLVDPLPVLASMAGQEAGEEGESLDSMVRREAEAEPVPDGPGDPAAPTELDAPDTRPGAEARSPDSGGVS